jgi:hypothetical protein
VEALWTNLIVNAQTSGSSVLKYTNCVENVSRLAESATGVDEKRNVYSIRDPAGSISQIVQAKRGFDLAADNTQSRAGQIETTEPNRLGDSR